VVQGFCRILPDFRGAEQPLLPLKVLMAKGFRFVQQALCSRALAGRYHPLQSLTIGFGTGAVILLPFALFNGLVVSYPASGWSILLYLGLVPTVLAYVLFLSGMRHTTATLASITTLLEPLTSTLLAWLFFKEQLGFFGLLGGMLLVGAILLLFRNDSRKNS
jgi:DME family drug/metabolite transporter